MQYKSLGHTGLQVSRYCLGAMMFGGIGNTDHDDCVRIIHRAIDAGVNFIDTADVYSQGESELIVGKAIKGRRDNLIVATKFYFPMGEDRNAHGGSRTWLVQEVDNSLQRLGTDYIDLYQIHRYDEHTDLEEILFTLTELVRQGKIRYFGSSMFPPDRIIESHWVAENRNLLRFRCEQPWYSIFSRDIERFVLPICHRYGMGVITWSPLDGGFLSGKYKVKQDLTPESRIGKFATRFMGGFDPEAELYQQKLALVGKLTKVAEKAGITLAQLAVAFVLEHPYVTSTIIGPRTMEHLEGLLPAADLKLDTTVLDRIDQIAPPGSSVNPPRDQPDGTALQYRRGR
ncbi:MAG: aldo/keto reductase [Gammaproteobacteria bacterium RIFCSPLOWO2_02_FULL_52_10]|nr:MAG: aldo/keto reductase [Gammaproteobacteria bacterium RIFCSPLOWO2_02_FULL_52_10]